MITRKTPTDPQSSMTALHTNVMLNPKVKEALIHPQRSLEVRGWIKTHHDVALHWRGSDGESMMHWAFLSDWVLANELREIGLSFADTDRFGRTPMDWLNDRLWTSIVDPATNHRLSAGGQERLRLHTEQQIQYLWNLEARPSNRGNALHHGVMWIRSGAWVLLDLIKEDNHQGWLNWMPQKGHALHAWVLSPNTPGRRAFLKTWIEAGLDVDVRDQDGRTPLWYALDAWVAAPQWRKKLLVVVKELLGAGASIRTDDVNGLTPFAIVARENNFQDEDFQELLMILDPEGDWLDQKQFVSEQILD